MLIAVGDLCFVSTVLVRHVTYTLMSAVIKRDLQIVISITLSSLSLLFTSSPWAASLTSLDITLLDNYSWASIVNIGDYILSQSINNVIF